MRLQKITFRKEEELSKKAQDDIMGILKDEGSEDIVIDFEDRLIMKDK